MEYIDWDPKHNAVICWAKFYKKAVIHNPLQNGRNFYQHSINKATGNFVQHIMDDPYILNLWQNLLLSSWVKVYKNYGN